MSRYQVQAVLFGFCFLMSFTLVASDGGTADDAIMDAGSNEDDTEESMDGGLSTDPVSIDATVTILTPTEGENLEGPWIDVSFHVQGCTVNSPSQDPDGCHLHKILDGVNYQEEGGGGLGHYNPTPLQMNIGTSGSHEIKLILVRNDGTDLAYEPEVGDSVTVNVDIEASQSEEEGNEDEEEEEEEYAAPIREKSEGCSCEASDPKCSFPAVLVGLFLLVFFRGRRRF